jgi:hypothetical protein
LPSAQIAQPYTATPWPERKSLTLELSEPHSGWLQLKLITLLCCYSNQVLCRSIIFLLPLSQCY